MTTKIINSWDWDVRVRDRNLKNETLNDKELEKYRGQLKDTDSQVDAVTMPQPALGGRES
jgi:argonaute-like protein implicated in RNA metabolism and viral defense